MALPTNAAEWRDRLLRRLEQRWQKMRVYDAYYNGDQELAFITKKYRDAYGNYFRGLTDNWMPLIVDSSSERMHVQGFRFGNKGADDEAWRIWQANGCDAQSGMVHTEAIKLGCAYWMVAPTGTDTPKITMEHPSQVIYECSPDTGEKLAGVKLYAEGDEYYVLVYLPDRVIGYRTTRRQLAVEPMDSQRRWETVSGESNPLGEVPLVEVPNNPTMLGGGQSDLAGGPMSIQNAINLLLSSVLIGAEYTAYPLRVLLGVDQPRDPRTNQPLENAELKMSRSRLLMFPGDSQNMDVKEFSPQDLENLRKQIDGLVRDLTAQTKTPPHYVSGTIVNASGDALKAAETGLVSKVKGGKMIPMGEAHEDTVRLAFKAVDKQDPRASATDCETIWADPETRSQAEVVDAAVKLATIGVPQEALWERIGASPQEIDRWRAMQERDQLLNVATTPPPVPGQDAGTGNGQVPEVLAGAGYGA